MATAGEEAEYESDPDDAPLPSMRRREASDDEGGEVSDSGRVPRPRHGIGYDGDSDGQGGAPAYDDEEEFDSEDGEDPEEEEEEVEEVLEIDDSAREIKSHVTSQPEPESGWDERMPGGEVVGYEEKDEVEEVEEEVAMGEKKDIEPYAVPIAGAFYMHDDRFRENRGRGRNRRMPSGRKLWESKEEHTWVHDRFEEMNLQNDQYDEGRRMSRGRFRGRGSGKTRGTDRASGRGNRSRAYYDNGYNQNHAPKTVKGRGPRRYVPALKNNNEVLATQQKEPIRVQEATTNSASRQFQESNVKPDPAPPIKHVFASSLSSASPPFYPSGASRQESSVMHKSNTQFGSIYEASSSSMLRENNFLAEQSGSFLKGKTTGNSFSPVELYMKACLPVVGGKPLVNPPLTSSVSTLLIPGTTQSSYSAVHGKGSSVGGPPNYHQTSLSPVARLPSQICPNVQHRLAQATPQHAVRATTQQLGQQPGSGTRASASPQLQSINSFEVREIESSSGSIKPNSSLVEMEKTCSQESGKGTFLYNGAQVVGATRAMNLSIGDQNFPATPAILSVMQLGGQHPGGLGVPAVGMALPGYVARPQLGLENSEMTWFPILAGAAGAFGASYCPPYKNLDVSNNISSLGQTSSSISSSAENVATKTGTMWKPPQSHEISRDEFEQRQNKPRSRYSEMNFGQ